MTTNGYLNEEPDAEVQLTPREELSEILRHQPGRIGQIHNLLVQGKTPKEVAEELAISPSSAPSYIAEYRNAINAILDGEIPSPSQIIPSTRKFKSFYRDVVKTLSKEARELLSHNGDLISAARNTLEPAIGARAERLAEQAEEAETDSLHSPGIYAFSYGHYLDFPVDPNAGNIFKQP